MSEMFGTLENLEIRGLFMFRMRRQNLTGSAVDWQSRQKLTRTLSLVEL